MTKRKKFTQDEALEECFKFVLPSNISKKDYSRFSNYRHRYREGKLGQKAIENILTFFGFTKIERWVKERNDSKESKKDSKSQNKS